MDDDAFFDALAGGSAKPGDDDPGRRLGARLRALSRRATEQDATDIAQQAKAGLSADDAELHARVWQRLVAEGHVQPLPAAPAPAVRRPPWQRAQAFIGGMFRSHGWQKGLAFGAIATMGVLVVWRIEHPATVAPGAEDESPGAVLRGGTDTVIAANPAARQAQLKAAFETVGAQVISVQTGSAPERWMLQVTLPGPETLAAANRIRADAGLPASPSLAFVLTVTGKSAARP